MAAAHVKQLDWHQRVALIRVSLHSASRSGDFGFFKSLAAYGLIDGVNHYATLTATLGDDADCLLAALDNLNGALAFMHQDAFQTVYDSLKDSMRDDDKGADKSKLYVDINMQKNKTEMAIDKLFNSAVTLIEQQPGYVQDEAANVYITGITLVADCIQVMIQQLYTIDQKMDDFIRLEESYNTVKASVLAANAGLKGIFYMLDSTDPQNEKAPRNMSISGASSALFRRMSSAFQQAPPSTSTRSSSIAGPGASAPRSSVSSTSSGPVYRTPNYVINSVSAGCPTSMPPNANAHSFNNFQSHKLSTIPPTPAGGYDEDRDPFDTTASAIVPQPALSLAQRRMSQAAF